MDKGIQARDGHVEQLASRSSVRTSLHLLDFIHDTLVADIRYREEPVKHIVQVLGGLRTAQVGVRVWENASMGETFRGWKAAVTAAMSLSRKRFEP
jgi:hypothetical protein